MPNERYAFRLRYTRCPRKKLDYPERELPLPVAAAGDEVKLKAGESDKTIGASGSLVLHGAGWATPEDAQRIGRFYTDVLARTCARLGLGSDFGERTAGKSWFTKYGLDLMSQKAGRPVINDVHGLMVYEQTSHPDLAFISMRGDAVVGISLEQFLSVFASAIARPRNLREEERAAQLLFNASFFPDSADGRFMLLMMAAEALISKRQRQSDSVKAILQRFQSEVDADASLTPEEQIVLKRGLSQLKSESIRQAGRRTVSEMLGARTYNGISAEMFFDLCYELRNKLAHGRSPLPSLGEVTSVVGALELMVSELLSTDLLDVGPQR